jgi:FkbM family methyltransferase
MNDAKEFASDECRVFSLLSKAGFAPQTIFDLGAANGTWSAFVSAVFPDAQFEMFEPLAELIPAYRKDLHWQLQNHPKFSLHAVALGSKNGQVSMRVHEDAYSSTLLDVGAHPEYQHRCDVSEYTLDDYVEKFALPLPDLIKLDTQGSEGAILTNGRRCVEHAQLVFAETWFVRAYGPETPLITELRELLDAHDYELAELGNRFYDQDHRLYSCDAFFLKRSLLSEVRRLMPIGPW